MSFLYHYYLLELLNEKLKFDRRPLTVTGVYFTEDPHSDSEPVVHQMILDRVENNHYVLKNSLIKYGGSELRIHMNRRYYADAHMLYSNENSHFGDFIYDDGNNKMFLVNEGVNPDKLNKERWYLCPQAYSVSLRKLPTPPGFDAYRNSPFGTFLLNPSNENSAW